MAQHLSQQRVSAGRVGSAILAGLLLAAKAKQLRATDLEREVAPISLTLHQLHPAEGPRACKHGPGMSSLLVDARLG